MRIRRVLKVLAADDSSAVPAAGCQPTERLHADSDAIRAAPDLYVHSGVV